MIVRGGFSMLVFVVLAAIVILMFAANMADNVAQLELTNHLGEVRPGDTESRMETWQRLEGQLRYRYDGDGYEYIAASCMLSKVANPSASNYGDPNPHLMIAACSSPTRCDYAIIGLLYDEPAVVTARGGVPKKEIQKDYRRDGCMYIEVDRAVDIMYGRIPFE